jgi:hypothetical protein
MIKVQKIPKVSFAYKKDINFMSLNCVYLKDEQSMDIIRNFTFEFSIKYTHHFEKITNRLLSGNMKNDFFYF